MSGRQLRSNSSKHREEAQLEEHLRTLDRLTHNLHLLDQITRSGHPAPKTLMNQLSHNQQRQEKIQEERREYMQRLKEKQKRGFYTQGTRLRQRQLRDLREQMNAAKALANEVYGKETPPTRLPPPPPPPPPPARLPQPPAHLPAPPQIIRKANQEIARRLHEREVESARRWAERRHLKQRQPGAPRPAAPPPMPHPVPRPAAPQERRPRSTQELRALNRTWSGNRIPNSTTRSGRKWKE